jgi:sigma-E factor negative regulatory protein RseB
VIAARRLLLLALALAPGLASAADAAPVASAPSALDELVRIRAAADTLTYTGVFVWQQGAEVHSSRITHTRDTDGGREKLQMLDGQPREFLRHRGEVRALMPEVRAVVIERAGVHNAAFPSLLQSDPAELAQHYRLKRIDGERVAAHETDAMALEPLDALRYGYRLFAEHRTGLLLKAQTIDDHGQVVEQMTFSEVRIGGPLEKGALEPSWNTHGWTVEQAGARPVDLGNWIVTRPVPGFERVTAVQRELAGHGEVSQIVFSDGMAAVSIFVEASNESQPAHETMSSEGSVNTLSRRHGAYWITVLGEAPAAAIRQFADALELKTSTP